MTDEEKQALSTLSKAGWEIRRMAKDTQTEFFLLSPPQSREPAPNQCAIQFHGRWWTFDQLRELTRGR